MLRGYDVMVRALAHGSVSSWLLLSINLSVPQLDDILKKKKHGQSEHCFSHKQRTRWIWKI